VNPDIALATDGNPAYGACAKDMGLVHSVTLSSDTNTHEFLKWVDTLTGNYKKFIDGTYHGGEEQQRLYFILKKWSIDSIVDT
jgi:hypothetical protein